MGEQMRLAGPVPERLGDPQPVLEAGRVVAHGQAALDRDIAAELVQGQHLEPPVAGRARLLRAQGQVGQRGGTGAGGVVRAAAQDQRAGGRLDVACPLARRERLRGERGRVAGRVPAHGVLAGPQPGPGRPQPVTRGRGVPGQGFRLAGEQRGGPLVMGQPGRLRRAGVQDLADEVVGELVIAPRDHEQPGLERRLAQLERARGHQVEQGAEGQRVDRGAEDGCRSEQVFHRQAGPPDAGLDRGPQ
jgi:hypothetical protein